MMKQSHTGVQQYPAKTAVVHNTSNKLYTKLTPHACPKMYREETASKMTVYKTNKIPYPAYKILISRLPSSDLYRPKLTKDTEFENNVKSETKPKKTHRIIQTVFRESQTQTDPYEPDVLLPVDKSLEILTLNWLYLNDGLPPSMTDSLAIERARQRRSWENSLPTPFDDVTRRLRDMILQAIAVNESIFRDDQMAHFASLRMELAEQCMRQQLSDDDIKHERLLKNYTLAKARQTYYEIDKARSELRRNLRKLTYHRNGDSRTYKKPDPVSGLTDKTSEYYGPQARFGTQARYRHEVIPTEFRYWNVFSAADTLAQDVNSFPKHRRIAFDYEKKSRPVDRFQGLCVRATRWTIHSLKVMHDQLKILHTSRKRSDSLTTHLKTRISTTSFRINLPKVERSTDDEDDLFKGYLFFQRTIKGRAVQSVMSEGRARCQELLDELKSTHALRDLLGNDQSTFRSRIYAMQRKTELEIFQENRKHEVLEILTGKTVSEVLDFLSKELVRLQEERDTHAKAMLAERERHRREAEEAGRREQELQRQSELDEMYKQICKVIQNSTSVANDEIRNFLKTYFVGLLARKKVDVLARKMDQEAKEANFCADIRKNDEIVADLVHNFALLETEKRIARANLKARQCFYLTSCHDAIYSQIESIARGPRTPSGVLKHIPRPQKHRIPPLPYVKVLKLRRMTVDSLTASQDSSESQSIFRDSFSNPDLSTSDNGTIHCR